MAGASGIAAMGGTGLASGQLQVTNRPQLIEVGLTFDAEEELDIKHRMPIDIPPKYRTSGDDIIPTKFADEAELRRLRGRSHVVSNGRINVADQAFGGQTESHELPLNLWNGRQPHDAAQVVEKVEEPQYSVSTKGSDASVNGRGNSADVSPGEKKVLQFPSQTYTIRYTEAVETDEIVTEEGVGKERGTKMEERTVEKSFVPTLTVRNRGKVDVLERGDEE